MSRFARLILFWKHINYILNLVYFKFFAPMPDSVALKTNGNSQRVIFDYIFFEFSCIRHMYVNVCNCTYTYLTLPYLSHMSLIKQSLHLMILFKSIRKCNTYIRDDTEIYFVISVLYIFISFFFYPFIFLSANVTNDKRWEMCKGSRFCGGMKTFTYFMILSSIWSMPCMYVSICLRMLEYSNRHVLVVWKGKKKIIIIYEYMTHQKVQGGKMRSNSHSIEFPFPFYVYPI